VKSKEKRKILKERFLMEPGLSHGEVVGMTKGPKDRWWDYT